MNVFLWGIICLVALLIGCLVTWMIMRSCKREGSSLQPTSVDSSSDLNNEVQVLQNKLEESQLEVAEFEKKAAVLSEKLKVCEAELTNLQKEFEGLVSLTPEERNEAILGKLQADIEKKSKEIKNNEEEIEELEDELSAIKKKLSKAKSEIEETTEALEKTNQKLKETENELRDVKQERDELEKEDAMKSEAIEFVNAVLTAHPADDKDAIHIKNKVSQIKSIILEQYLPALDDPFYAGWEQKNDWKDFVRKAIGYWGNLQEKSWLKGKKVVAFIGEFSAGKTSIVNRILSQDNPDCPTLPVSSKATTAIATYISYGAGFLSQFTDANDDLKHLSKEMFLKVNKDILGKINANSLIRHFVMKYNNDNLKGLSILDTPGFSSNDKEDQDRTLDVIREADALFWVMDANTGEINRTSLDIIAKNIQGLPLYVVINKSDTKSSGELDKLEQHIRQTMERAEIDVKGYIRFSQKSKINELMNVIQSLEAKNINNDISFICSDIQSDINLLDKKMKSLRQDIRKYEKIIENREEVILSDLETLKDSSQRVASIPKPNSRWFHANDYRMDQEEYQELSEHCDLIECCSDNIEGNFQNFKDYQTEYRNLLEERDNTKEQIKNLQNILNQLKNTLKSLDSNVYKEVIDILKQESKSSKTRIRNEQDEDETADKDFANTASSGANSSSNEKEGLKAFQKAIQFQNQGSEQEAKFWFIRSAELGYKDGQQRCKALGYKY